MPGCLIAATDISHPFKLLTRITPHNSPPFLYQDQSICQAAQTSVSFDYASGGNPPLTSVFQVPEVPLVLSDAAESVTKTSKAVEILKKIGALPDVEKAKNSKAIRSGLGE